MSFQTVQDVPLIISVPSDPNSLSTSQPLVRSERRVTPTWTIQEFKTRLEPITGIPASYQSLRTLAVDGSTWINLAPDSAQVGDSRWGFTRNSEIQVVDLRPPGTRENFSDVSGVDKYIMPEEQYERLDDSVLAWKKKQKLGRFDPSAKSLEQLVEERAEKDRGEIQRKGIKVGSRCRINGSDERRGMVRYVGEIEGLGGDREKGCVWIGVEFDEPVGRNDGSVEVESEKGHEKEKKKVFQTRGKNYGGLVRPEKVEVGDEFGVLDDLMGSDMEEI